MKVLMFSPGFPAEMPYFTRGLKNAGATVIGIGDQPATMLPRTARDHIDHYVRVEDLWSEGPMADTARRIHREIGLDRIECLWEPGMLVAAQMREAIGLRGMTVDETVPFRDKEVMKRVLDRAGVRTPRHRRASSADQVRTAAAEVGYPLIVKPIAGAGSADTHRVDDAEALEAILPKIAHVPTVSVEEYIDGEEYTFDTVCAGGEVLYENVSWYRPRPLLARTLEWVSPQTVALRNLERPEARLARSFGRDVLRALGFRTGFTHMEWFLKPDGEAVFGEIAARPPGARSVDIMNYACDMDIFDGWAHAITQGRLGFEVHRPYNAIVVFKRAEGQGRIRRIDGLEALLGAFGESVVACDLLPIGAPRRNWKQTLLSDGSLIVRHPDLETAMRMADRIGTDLRIHAA